jgi:hypothetical protein
VGQTQAMLSVLLMFRRLFAAVRYAAREEGFLAIFGAGIVLVLVGTLTYSTSQDWSVVDAFYFAVCTLTTSSIADPSLTLDGGLIKIFTVFYVLVGIGILVELARQVGFGYVRMRAEHESTRHPRRHKSDPSPPSTQ